MTDFITAVWALRWILTAIAFLTLGGFYAEALHRVRQLEDENAGQALTIRRLRVLIAARRARRPIIAGRVIS